MTGTGKGHVAISCHTDKGSSSGEVMPRAELKVVREKLGREKRRCKGPEAGPCEWVLGRRGGGLAGSAILTLGLRETALCVLPSA